MARSSTERAANRAQESLFWLQFAVIAGVIMVLLAVIWALMTATSIESSAPRTAYERQMRLLKDSVEKAPDSVDAWAKYIRAQAQGGQIQAARRSVDEADKALGIRKGQIETEVARIEFLGGDAGAALEGVDAALDLIKAEAEAEAERLSAMGVVQEPNQAPAIDAYLLRAEILIEQDDPASAAEAYGAALALDATMSDIYVQRGLLYEQLGQTDKAKADFTSALTYIPDYAPALDALDRLER